MNPEGRDCSEQRLCHSTIAWATVQDCALKNKTKQKGKRKEKEEKRNHELTLNKIIGKTTTATTTYGLVKHSI